MRKCSVLAVMAAAILFAGCPSSVGFATEDVPSVKEFLNTCAKVTAQDVTPGHPYSDAYIDCTNAIMGGSLTPGGCAPPKPTSYIDCPNAIMRSSLKPGGCAPPKPTGTDDIRVAVVDWLKRHPETYAMDEFAGTATALKALYCH
jgi:hypothetical protein